jgi:hypothetical protein
MESRNGVTERPESEVAGDDTALWRRAALALLILSLLRGIRFPNLWSYTHYLFNYDFGFTKRGLTGAVLSWVDSPYLRSYECFVYVSAAVLAANVVLLYSLMKEAIAPARPLLGAATLVFASSMAVVFLAHSIGYGDNLGLLLTLVVLKRRSFWQKLFLVTALAPVALLVHEAVAVIFFPVMLASLAFAIPKQRRTSCVLLLGVLAALMLSLAAVVQSHQLSEQALSDMRADLQVRTETPLRPDTFVTLRRAGSATVPAMMRIWRSERGMLRMGTSSLVLAPTVLMCLYVTWSCLTRVRAHRVLKVLAACASLAPLLMHVVAWDTERWNALVATTSFLVACLVCLANADCALPLSRRTSRIATCVVVLNAMSSIQLMDSYAVKQFPFQEHILYVLSLIQGTGTFPYVPLR